MLITKVTASAELDFVRFHHCFGSNELGGNYIFLVDARAKHGLA
jgi:hypothetical protein